MPLVCYVSELEKNVSLDAERLLRLLGVSGKLSGFHFAVYMLDFGGNDVLVKLPAIPMPPLLMEQVLRFAIGPVKKFIDFQRDLHGHSLSVIIDGNFHLPFLHSDFFGKSEWGGGERHRG